MTSAGTFAIGLLCLVVGLACGRLFLQLLMTHADLMFVIAAAVFTLACFYWAAAAFFRPQRIAIALDTLRRSQTGIEHFARGLTLYFISILIFAGSFLLTGLRDLVIPIALSALPLFVGLVEHCRWVVGMSERRKRDTSKT